MSCWIKKYRITFQLNYSCEGRWELYAEAIPTLGDKPWPQIRWGDYGEAVTRKVLSSKGAGWLVSIYGSITFHYQRSRQSGNIVYARTCDALLCRPGIAPRRQYPIVRPEAVNNYGRQQRYRPTRYSASTPPKTKVSDDGGQVCFNCDQKQIKQRAHNIHDHLHVITT